ncbi:hypothetical protein [Roseicyclus elongatus]|uniref:hypothetical protein n=1 Tax=Roseicyclus elongatus TaxID=159346 RepID=UPI0012EC6E80|nr:hypothetical protein [Roseibacterium elongatum]
MPTVANRQTRQGAGGVPDPVTRLNDDNPSSLRLHVAGGGDSGGPGADDGNIGIDDRLRMKASRHCDGS